MLPSDFGLSTENAIRQLHLMMLDKADGLWGEKSNRAFLPQSWSGIRTLETDSTASADIHVADRSVFLSPQSGPKR